MDYAMNSGKEMKKGVAVIGSADESSSKVQIFRLSKHMQGNGGGLYLFFAERMGFVFLSGGLNI